jgi:tripartite-type tricarboxylate transporter receptor subunit TctC
MKKLLLALLMVTSAALAADFPSRPIQLVIPNGAGPTDNVARVLAAAVSEQMDQQVIVVNKPGANGLIAATEVARAKPDGYTLLIATNSQMSAMPMLVKNMPYDPVKSFVPITDVGRYTFFVYVNPDLPVSTMAGLIAYAKRHPGELNYANNVTLQLATMAQIKTLTGATFVDVPYKGEPPAVLDVVAGRIQVIVATPASTIGLAREGKLRPLATLGRKRSPLFPDVPTMEEAGLKGFQVISWAGLFAPAGTPVEVQAILNRKFTAAMMRPDVLEQMEKQDFLLNPSTGEELAAFVDAQLLAYQQILSAAGIQPQ